MYYTSRSIDSRHAGYHSAIASARNSWARYLKQRPPGIPSSHLPTETYFLINRNSKKLTLSFIIVVQGVEDSVACGRAQCTRTASGIPDRSPSGSTAVPSNTMGARKSLQKIFRLLQRLCKLRSLRVGARSKAKRPALRTKSALAKP